MNFQDKKKEQECDIENILGTPQENFNGMRMRTIKELSNLHSMISAIFVHCKDIHYISIYLYFQRKPLMNL